MRGAIPNFAGIVSKTDLIDLACRDDVRSRLVVRDGRTWETAEGPFSRARLRRLPPRNWSLLVHDVNHFVPGAQALLDRFSFIPYARLDDLMISYAPPGGGVGPHFDSYDVFLLQGSGRRRWQISQQSDRSLIADAPLKLLRTFRSEQEWLTDPGDLLYLPPGCAHNGVAIDECMTYSIGFRAPAWQELAIHFLRFLEDRIQLTGLYEDPELKLQRGPAGIGRNMLERVTEQLEAVRWKSDDVAQFLGAYLTEPKSHVYFTAPERRMTRATFAERARANGVALEAKTQMLYQGDRFFINGDATHIKGRARETLRQLADRRSLATLDSSQRGLVTLLHEWYEAGWLRIRPRRANLGG